MSCRDKMTVVMRNKALPTTSTPTASTMSPNAWCTLWSSGAAMLGALPDSHATLALAVVAHPAVVTSISSWSSLGTVPSVHAVFLPVSDIFPMIAPVLPPIQPIFPLVAAILEAVFHLLAKFWMFTEKMFTLLRRSLLQSVLRHFLSKLGVVLEKLTPLFRVHLFKPLFLLLH